jgi:PAS domain S-box-containing protein
MPAVRHAAPCSCQGVHSEKSTEEALRDSEALYHSLVESLPVNILRKDLDGRFTFGNSGFCQTIGKQPDEFIGRTDFDLFPESLAAKYRQDDLDVIQTGKTYDTEEEHHTPDGQTLYVHVLKTPVNDSRGRIVGTQAIFWDVTKRRRAEAALLQAEEKYRSIFEHAAEGIFQSTPDGKITSANPALAAIYGYASSEQFIAEIQDASRGLYVNPGRRDEFLRLMDEQSTVHEFESEIYRRDGSIIWISEKARAVRDARGAIKYFEGTITDITDRKHKERRLAIQAVVSSTLSDCSRLSEAAPTILQALCNNLGWDVGSIRTIDPDAGIIRCVGAWQAEGLDLGSYLEAEMHTALELSDHFTAGGAWMISAPYWKRSVSDNTCFPLSAKAAASGLNCALLCPVLFQGDVVGLISLLSRRFLLADPEMAAIIEALGSQIGQFVARRHAECEMLAAKEQAETANRALKLSFQALEEARRKEIGLAARIQQGLLVEIPPDDLAWARVAALAVPSQQVDGDFYDFYVHSDDSFDMVIGDVMGKGVPAALQGAAIKSRLLRALVETASRSSGTKLPSPASIIDCVQQNIGGQLIELDSFATLCYARFDRRKKRIVLVDAGHTKAIHRSSSGDKCSFLRGTNLPLGISNGDPWVETTARIHNGDMVFMHSDGVTEAKSPSGELFGIHRLVSVIESHRGDARELVDAVRGAVVSFTKSCEFSDDFTCIAVQVENL